MNKNQKKLIKLASKILTEKALCEVLLTLSLKDAELKTEEWPMPEKKSFALVAYKPDQINLEKFLRCLIDKDFSALVLYGEATEDDIKVAWSKLINAYNDLKGGSSIQGYIDIQSRIYELEFRRDWIERNIELLTLCYAHNILDEAGPVINVFNEYGYNLSFNADTIEDDIKRIRTGEKAYIIELTSLENKKHDLYGAKSKELSRSKFEKEVAELIKHEKYGKPVSQALKEWLLSDYCLYHQRYVDAHPPKEAKS